MAPTSAKLLTLLIAAVALASAASITIPANLYGHLDQNTTDFCKDAAGNSYACGPVATVNSLRMLDNRYGSTLIPDIGAAGIDNVDLTAVASTLSGLMGCTPCNGGTTVADLISGKRTYLNQTAPGKYFVHSSASPTFQWLFNELTAGQDIEILIGFYNGNTRLSGHYLTVNGVSWTDAGAVPDGIIQASEATLSFIDPAGGTNGSNTLFEQVQGGSLRTGYGVGGLIGTTPVTVTSIEWAIAESPVPEPGTIALMFAASVVAWWRYRRPTRQS